MPVKNIIPAFTPLVNSKFEPLAGGSIYCFTPGGAKTDFIVVYKDSALTIPHTNPVKISGSGRAEVWASANCDVRIEDRNGNLIKESLSVNPSTLGENQGSGLITNGNFELDTDSDGTPDDWSLSSESGATNAIDTTDQSEGLNSFRFTSVAAGGGQLVTEDYFAVNDADDLRVDFDIKASVGTGNRNIVRVEWYDASKVSISNTDVYDSSTPPTSWQNQGLTASPPSGARFAKLRIIGIDTSTPIAASVYFDRFVVFYPAVTSGIIDNITIQNNQIITTNTNGDLEIKAHGTGSVNINQGTHLEVDLTDTNNPLNVGSEVPDTEGHLAISRTVIQAKSDQTTATNLAIQPLGGSLNLGPQSGTGTVTLLHNGNDVGTTLVNGFAARSVTSPGIGSSQSVELALQQSDGVKLGFIGYESNAFMEIRSLNHGQPILLRGENAAGTVVNLMNSYPDGASTLYHSGAAVVQTRDDGFNLLGSINNPIGGAQDSFIRFQTSSGENIGNIGFSGSTAFNLNSANHGANFIISGEPTAGGGTRVLIIADPDDKVNLYHAGNDVVRTATSASGGLEVNNESTGGGFERVLTDSDAAVISTGTITPVWQGFSSNPAMGFTWQKVEFTNGRAIVMLKGDLDDDTAASNSSQFSFSSLPTDIRPSLEVSGYITLIDDGIAVGAVYRISTAGIVMFNRMNVSGSDVQAYGVWTASGLKGFTSRPTLIYEI